MRKGVIMLVEEKKEETKLEQRERHRKLSKDVLQGNLRTEPLVVLGADGEEFESFVHALGEGQIQECLDRFNMSFEDLANPKIRTMEKLKVWRCLAAKAISTPQEQWTNEEIGKALGFGSPLSISLKCLELSGLIKGLTVDQMALFRRTKHIQQKD